MARAAVIGGGMAGLASAVSLAARGHAVTLLEERDEVGGKARAARAAGAVIDLGPTILTDLDPLRRLFAESGTSLEATASLARVDPGLFTTFPDGRRLSLHTRPELLAEELRALGAAGDWARFLDLGRRAARLTAHYYERGDVAGVRELAAFALGGAVSAADILPFARRASLASLLGAAIATPELRRLLAHGARFTGLEAERAPAVTLVIAYLLAAEGVWYPIGGIAALAAAIGGVAAKLGVAIERGEAAAGLELGPRGVAAVTTRSGRRLPVDVCVSAVDLSSALAWLPRRRRARRLRPALSARVAWWVVAAPPAIPVHHALHFREDPAAEPLYVATPTVTDPEIAPPGTTVVYALEHGEPARLARPGFAESLRRGIERAGQWPEGPVLARGLSGSAQPCYGYRTGRGLFSSFRPSQRVAGVPNLFLAGGSVFPGPGVSNAVRSGLRAAALAHAALQAASA